MPGRAARRHCDISKFIDLNNLCRSAGLACHKARNRQNDESVSAGGVTPSAAGQGVDLQDAATRAVANPPAGHLARLDGRPQAAYDAAVKGAGDGARCNDICRGRGFRLCRRKPRKQWSLFRGDRSGSRLRIGRCWGDRDGCECSLGACRGGGGYSERFRVGG